MRIKFFFSLNFLFLEKIQERVEQVLIEIREKPLVKDFCRLGVKKFTFRVFFKVFQY